MKKEEIKNLTLRDILDRKVTYTRHWDYEEDGMAAVEGWIERKGIIFKIVNYQDDILLGINSEGSASDSYDAVSADRVRFEENTH